MLPGVAAETWYDHVTVQARPRRLPRRDILPEAPWSTRSHGIPNAPSVYTGNQDVPASRGRSGREGL